MDRPGLLDSWYSRLRMTEAVQELSQRKGTDTRERILDVAEAAVLEKGFAATSIDELVAAVSITKSGFFYHFRDKGELAKALLARYMTTCSGARTSSMKIRCMAFLSVSK